MTIKSYAQVTHKLTTADGKGDLMLFRIYKNGRTDFSYCKPGGEQRTSRSPSLASDLSRGGWRGAVRHCYGSAVVDYLETKNPVFKAVETPPAFELPKDVASMQRAIFSGTCWHLQGVYGRAAMAALDNGDCMLPRMPENCTVAQIIRDAYGTPVPFRCVLKDGTKGTRGLVVAMHGEDYALALEALEGKPFTLADVQTLEHA